MTILEGVKVGDKLFHGGRSPYVTAVVRVTKLHAENDRGTKYNIKTGYAAGERDPWHPDTASLYDEATHGPILRAHKEETRLHDIWWRMRNCRRESLNKSQFERIDAILKESSQ